MKWRPPPDPGAGAERGWWPTRRACSPVPESLVGVVAAVELPGDVSVAFCGGAYLVGGVGLTGGEGHSVADPTVDEWCVWDVGGVSGAVGYFLAVGGDGGVDDVDAASDRAKQGVDTHAVIAERPVAGRSEVVEAEPVVV